MLKSDQEGIEIVLGGIFGQAIFRLLKSDQEGIEIFYVDVTYFHATFVKIRPRRD